MNIFKKKQTEVCGYLDRDGKFYTDKHQRDLQNAKYERALAKSAFNQRIKHEKLNFAAPFPPEYSEAIDYLIDNGRIANLANAYFEYKKTMADIDNKYGK